ncbi:Domain of uncharacterised function (DUF2825) [Escherichia coli]|nr:Domain of uncharacterised function (DUF2825) [Escherichia coli]CAD6535633.1 Domain of uncharacterised function (DUF2825) [Escherichia coli]
MKKIRFIPAGAGNTRPCNRNGDFNSVYPRWRGEHCWMSLSNTERSGLSPLARGTLCYPLKTADSRRFIPAGAGNTLLPAQNRRFASVYPRWRGEHSASVQAGTRYSGLSPLARGTLCYPLKTADSRRFIPAGAGNTRPASRLAPDIPVYPRWRGEHSINCGGSEANSGLSPLARGTHTAANYGSRNARFIPAGAGNTLSIHICF